MRSQGRAGASLRTRSGSGSRSFPGLQHREGLAVLSRIVFCNLPPAGMAPGLSAGGDRARARVGCSLWQGGGEWPRSHALLCETTSEPEPGYQMNTYLLRTSVTHTPAASPLPRTARPRAGPREGADAQGHTWEEAEACIGLVLADSLGAPSISALHCGPRGPQPLQRGGSPCS